MAITVVASTFEQSATGSDVTTPDINTTGAVQIIVAAIKQVGKTITVQDNKGNTYVPAEDDVASADVNVQMYESSGANLTSVGANHNFTIDAPDFDTYPWIGVIAIGGAAGGSDEDNEDAGAVASLNPGPITPTADGAIVIVGAGFGGGATLTINEGFTIIGQDPEGAGNWGGMAAYLIQTTAAVADPTVGSGGAATQMAAKIISFLAAGGGGGFVPSTPHRQSDPLLAWDEEYAWTL